MSADQTIQPTQIAGFNQFFNDLNGTEGWRYGAGLDAVLTEDINIGIEVSKRDLTVPFFRGGNDLKADQDEELYRAYFYWAPLNFLSVNAEARYETFDRGEVTRNENPTKLDTLSLPIEARFFSPTGFFGTLGVAFIHQDVDRTQSSTLRDGNNSFTLVDLGAGFRFPERRGLIALEIRNLLDEDFNFQDDSFRTASEDSVAAPFLPDRTVLARLILNF